MDRPADQLEVYTQFGIAAEIAQALEMRARDVALVYMSFLVGTDETTPGITPQQTEWFRSSSEAFYEAISRKTLGRLLRGIKQFAPYDETLLETTDEALVKRNYLMHHFFSSHKLAIQRVEGRKEMIAELDEIQQKLGVALVFLGGIYDALRRLKPLSPRLRVTGVGGRPIL